MNKTVIIAIIAVIVVGAAAFFGGMQYQKAHAASGFANGQFTRGQGFQGGPGRFGGRGGNGGATVGQVVSSDANSVTVKMQDGSSKIVNLSGSTKITKTDTASASDIKTGERVAAFGTSNSDGSISAVTVQINPAMGFGGGNRPSGTPGQ